MCEILGVINALDASAPKPSYEQASERVHTLTNRANNPLLLGYTTEEKASVRAAGRGRYTYDQRVALDQLLVNMLALRCESVTWVCLVQSPLLPLPLVYIGVDA